MQKDEIMLKVENVSKIYRLGEIGGTTLRDELQRLGAKIRHKEDPTKKIGAKNYNKGEKFKALDNISFEVKKGERIGIIGHNGAGKSTLLKLISRVTGPTDGKIYLNGRVASMLEVGTGFHPELTGRENVYMNGAILGMTKKEIDSKMEDIIEFSEVRQFIDTPVKRYSSGMYVKLAFSVAAHLDSEIMIMDEVLAVGDMAFQNKCLNKMRSVSEEDDRTILYVSHNMNTIRQLCNRVIVLNQGRVIFNGDVEEGIKRYYSETLDCYPIAYDYTNVPRLYNFGKEAKILSFRFLAHNDAVFTNEDRLSFEVRIKSNLDISNALFRFSIRTEMGETIGTSISKPFNLKQTDDKKIILSFALDELTEGKYITQIMFGCIDSNQFIFEYDNPGIKMPIVIKKDVQRGIKWQHKYHGSVNFEDLELYAENKKDN